MSHSSNSEPRRLRDIVNAQGHCLAFGDERYYYDPLQPESKRAALASFREAHPEHAPQPATRGHEKLAAGVYNVIT